MNLTNQVTSRELSQKLKDLGVKQESLFYWWKNTHPSDKFILINPVLDDRTVKSYIDAYPKAEMYSAFTVAELGEMLPKGCFTTKTNSDEFPWRCEFKQTNGYTSASGSNTEAEARGLMLCYLLENKLI